MAVTYEPIASVTLGSDTANIEFTSIPGTYTDLVLVLHGRQSIGADQSIEVTVNGDSGTNYSATALQGSGSAASSSRWSSVARIYVGEMSGTTANYPSPITVHFQSYANTNVYKTVLAAWAAPASLVGRGVGLWRSTNAITSIKIQYYGSGIPTLKSGFTASLYGIKAA